MILQSSLSFSVIVSDSITVSEVAVVHYSITFDSSSSSVVLDLTVVILTYSLSIVVHVVGVVPYIVSSSVALDSAVADSITVYSSSSSVVLNSTVVIPTYSSSIVVHVVGVVPYIVSSSVALDSAVTDSITVSKVTVTEVVVADKSSSSLQLSVDDDYSSLLRSSVDDDDDSSLL